MIYSLGKFHTKQINFELKVEFNIVLPGMEFLLYKKAEYSNTRVSRKRFCI